MDMRVWVAGKTVIARVIPAKGIVETSCSS